LRYDHENDTEDIPTNPWYDPIELKKRKRGEPFVSNDELAQQAEDSRMEKQSNEIQAIMTEQT
jgi:hypothetical protein